MDLFHKLRDVYFGAIKLRDELNGIPPQCDCRDADAHLGGRCCCADNHSHAMKGGGEAQAGCIVHLAELSKSIHWFQEDLRRERSLLRPGDAEDGLEGRLMLIASLIDGLSWAVGCIGVDLQEFRATCAHPALARLKKRGDELERYINGLNDVL